MNFEEPVIRRKRRKKENQTDFSIAIQPPVYEDRDYEKNTRMLVLKAKEEDKEKVINSKPKKKFIQKPFLHKKRKRIRVDEINQSRNSTREFMKEVMVLTSGFSKQDDDGFVTVRFTK